MIPTHINNIFGIRINSASNNTAITYGNAAQKGHQANVKMNSGYTQPGDANFSPLQFNNANFSSDPDFTDQPQSQV
ncbi:spore germination protein [Oceanobacillus halotolerans]|uniref:spore germination protein n=1 Tax=Oceanobacillus halotolerans TaxID=2663380 RepID=UPI0013D8F1CA|nr:spore germination protein [Oceanobacillus halotolerans]